MADSITVNGVVFEYLGSGGGTTVYMNGGTMLVRVESTKQWDARIGGKMSSYQRSPGAALSELDTSFRQWQLVGVELARLGIGGGK